MYIFMDIILVYLSMQTTNSYYTYCLIPNFHFLEIMSFCYTENTQLGVLS